MKNKIIYIILIFGLIFSCVGSQVLAATGEEQVQEAVGNLNNPNGDKAYETLSNIMSIMAWVGFAIAVFKLMQIGIMFMTGIANKRSNAKDAIVPWVIGCLICALFGILGPWFIGIIASGDNGDVFGTGTSQTQQGAPQQGTAQQGTPQQGTPQQGTPQQGTPQQGTPQQGDPQQDPQQEPQSEPETEPQGEPEEEAEHHDGGFEAGW